MPDAGTTALKSGGSDLPREAESGALLERAPASEATVSATGIDIVNLKLLTTIVIKCSLLYIYIYIYM